MCHRSPEALRATIAQHAAILTLRDILQSNNNPIQSETEIQCFAQDPAYYTDINKTILQRAGITLLNDPRAFCEVDESSIVLAVALDVPVRQVVLDIARPAIMIWDKVLSEEETIALYDNPAIAALAWKVDHVADMDAPEMSFLVQEHHLDKVDEMERFM